jgi:hypothetical protein
VLLVVLALNLMLSPAPRALAATSFTDIGAGLAGDIAWGATMSWADYDTDGDLDMALAGYWTLAHGPILKIYRNTNGSFADSNTLFPGFPSGAYGIQNAALAWGDYDNDGDPDLAVSGIVNNTDQLISRIYRNDGGSFVDIQAGLLAVTSGSLDWGDYDNDGDLDLLLIGQDKLVNGTPLTRIYQNNAGTFTAIQAGLPDIVQGKAAWATMIMMATLICACAAWRACTRQAPRNVPANTTVIAALSTTGMTAPMLVSGATDHHVVEAYVEHVLGRPRVQL